MDRARAAVAFLAFAVVAQSIVAWLLAFGSTPARVGSAADAGVGDIWTSTGLYERTHFTWDVDAFEDLLTDIEFARQLDDIHEENNPDCYRVAALSLRRQLTEVAAGWPGNSDVILHIEAGWPLRSFSGDLHLRAYFAGSQYGRSILDGALGFDRVVAGSTVTRAVPLRPVWPGFVVNTVLYAATATVVLRVIRLAYGRLRTTLGKCPSCGYPVGVSEVCTECGGEVRAAR